LKRLSLIVVFITISLLLSSCDVLLTGTPDKAEETGLTVHFFDVGQADAALVVCDGAAMLIDGGNPSDSDFIYTFLKNHNISHLDYIVASHSHSDHVGGLAGAMNFSSVGAALSPVAEFDSRAFDNFIKYLDERKVPVTIPNHGDTFWLGGADVSIVGPINPSDEPNNMSIVIKITYGDTGFLFTGDAERPLEQDILEEGYDISATVLKVGHHGSDSSTTYPFLREIMPRFAVISCGADNPYGHPHENLLSRLRDADVTLFRTDMQGTITAVSDGTTVTMSTERNANVQTNPLQKVDNAQSEPDGVIINAQTGPDGVIINAQTEPYGSPENDQASPDGPLTNVQTNPDGPSATPEDEEYYIGNSRSKKYHRPSCSGLPAEQNRLIFATREFAASEGYEPCGSCKP